MSHVTSPVLRRLRDEPQAVPDRARRHLTTCRRCQASSSKIAANATRAARLLAVSPPPSMASPDAAWQQLQARLQEPAAGTRPPVHLPWPLPRRAVNVSLGTGTVVAAGVLVVGVGAAAALTTVYAPTKVAPVRVGADDMHAIASITRIAGSGVTDGLPPTGARRLPFADVSWASAGRASSVPSLAQARAQTALPLTAPAQLPSGVGALHSVMIQPKVTVTVRFDRSADGAVAGSTLEITGGPGAVAQYGSAAGADGPPTMVIAAMQRPVASSVGTTTSQLEAFLLSRPGLPAGLAQEIRLLGSSTLPVPVPAGVQESHVTVGGAPAVLIVDPSGTAAGVIWEGRDGVVHGVAGLLDSKDILNVARQLG